MSQQAIDMTAVNNLAIPELIEFDPATWESSDQNHLVSDRMEYCTAFLRCAVSAISNLHNEWIEGKVGDNDAAMLTSLIGVQFSVFANIIVNESAIGKAVGDIDAGLDAFLNQETVD